MRRGAIPPPLFAFLTGAGRNRNHYCAAVANKKVLLAILVPPAWLRTLVWSRPIRCGRCKSLEPPGNQRTTRKEGSSTTIPTRRGATALKARHMSMALSAQVLPALAARTHAARGGRRASSVGKARAARHAIETRRSPSGWGALIPRVHTGGPEKKVEAPHAAARRLVVVHGTEDEVDAVTKKWGLEAGLWKAFRSKPTEGETEGKSSGMDTAKKLLKRYGSAYLITSISLSLVSITICYVLVSAGVDVASILDAIGLGAYTNGEKVGTFAIAYAAHKALSPVRFPPTVALTPVVAGWMGKDVKPEDEDGDGVTDGEAE